MQWRIVSHLSTMLRRSFSPRLLKNVQMSLDPARDGITHPRRMSTRRGARPDPLAATVVPLVVSLSNHAALRERAG
jgi:hypothetical protein